MPHYQQLHIVAHFTVNFLLISVFLFGFLFCFLYLFSIFAARLAGSCKLDAILKCLEMPKRQFSKSEFVQYNCDIYIYIYINYELTLESSTLENPHPSFNS